MTDPDAWLEIGARLRPVLEKRRVLRAIVFGSFARGEVSRHSDLDLILIQETDKRFLDRYDDFLRAIAQAVPGRDVDLLTLRRCSGQRLYSTGIVAYLHAAVYCQGIARGEGDLRVKQRIGMRRSLDKFCIPTRYPSE